MKTRIHESWTKAVVLIAVCLFCLTGLYQPVFAETPAELWQLGHEAYTNNRYLHAVLYLYAYKQMCSGTNVADAPIDYARNQVQLAIDTRAELLSHGHVTKLIVDKSGKADGFGTYEEEVRYNPPNFEWGPKPKLSAKPPIPFSSLGESVGAKATEMAEVATGKAAKIELDACRDKLAQLSDDYERLAKLYVELKEENDRLAAEKN